MSQNLNEQNHFEIETSSPPAAETSFGNSQIRRPNLSFMSTSAAQTSDGLYSDQVDFQRGGSQSHYQRWAQNLKHKKIPIQLTSRSLRGPNFENKLALERSIQVEKDKVLKQEIEIENWKAKYEKLETQNSHQKNDQLSKELNSCKNEIDLLKIDKIQIIEDNESQNRLFQDQVEEYKNRISDIQIIHEKMISQLKNDHQKVVDKLEEKLCQKFRTSEIDLFLSLNREPESEKSQIEKLVKEINSQKCQIFDKDGEIPRLKSQITSLTEENDKIQKKYDKISDSCSSKIETLVKECKEEVGREKYQLFQKNKQMDILTGEIVNIKNERDKFEQEIKDLENKIFKLKEKNSKKTKELKAEKKKIEKLENDNKNKCEDLKRKVKILQDLKDASILNFKFLNEKFEEGLPQEIEID